MKPRTPEQEVDVKKRVEEFQKKLQDLQKEFEVEVVAVPSYVPTQQGFTTLAQTMIMDTKYLPKPSPIQRDGVIQEG